MCPIYLRFEFNTFLNNSQRLHVFTCDAALCVTPLNTSVLNSSGAWSLLAIKRACKTQDSLQVSKTSRPERDTLPASPSAHSDIDLTLSLASCQCPWTASYWTLKPPDTIAINGLRAPKGVSCHVFFFIPLCYNLSLYFLRIPPFHHLTFNSRLFPHFIRCRR